MPWSLAGFYLLLPAFMLVLSRVAGLVLAAPLFASVLIPMRLKILLCCAVSLAVFPMVAAQVRVPLTLATAVVGMVGELMIGLFVGFGVSLVFLGVELALELVGHQSGLGLGASFNPLFEATSTAAGELFQLLLILVFLCVGGHRALVRGLLDSFATLPPLSVRVTEDLAAVLVDLLTLSFQLAIRVGGPTLLALMLALVTLGFVSRTLPQLNLFTVGFPLKLSVALAVLGLTLVSFESVMIEALTDGLEDIAAALAAAGRP